MFVNQIPPNDPAKCKLVSIGSHGNIPGPLRPKLTVVKAGPFARV